MRDGGQPDKPSIRVLSHAAGPIEIEVLAGIEEEGVPALVERPGGAGDPENGDDAAALAGTAAGRSSLSVGIGIDARGHVCVRHDKLVRALPELSSIGAADPATARRLGHNAARIVVGIPLRVGRFD